MTKQPPKGTQEERKQVLRRDLNDLVRSPDGKVSEAKSFAVTFKFLMLYVFLYHTDKILSDWAVLAIFVAAFIAPDILKKVLTMKIGAPK